MSKTPEYTFVWSDGALIPAALTINIPLFNTDGTMQMESDAPGAKPKTEAVRFYELPRKKLVQFLADSTGLKVIEELEEMEDRFDPVSGDTVQVHKTKKLPIEQVANEHSDLFFIWLAEMTNGAKTAQYFEDLPIGSNGIAALVEMFMEVNHVNEVLASSGNWLMLPEIQKVLRKPEEGEEKAASA